MSTQGITYHFKAIDGMSGVVQNISNKVNSLGGVAEKAGGKLDFLKDSLKTAAGMMFRDFANSISNSIDDSMKLGAQVGTLKNSFDSLVKTTGATNLSLESLQKATKNTISDVEILTSANRALSLGIPADRINDLYASALKLGPAMGLTAAQAVDRLSVGVGRMSKLVLDDLGIVFDATEAYDWYAHQLGVTANELDEGQRKLAWQNYAMELVTERANELGDTMSDAQLQQERWNASIENTKTGLGAAAGPLAGFIGAMQPFIPMLTLMATSLIPKVVSSLIAMVAQYGVAGTATHLLTVAQGALSAVMNANPIFLIVTAIAALIAILVLAYTHCKPFRDVINAIGNFFKNVFLGAVQAVGETLEWLYKKIFKPIAQFVKGTLIPAIKPLTDVLGGIGSVLGGIASALFGSPHTIFEDAAKGVRMLGTEIRRLPKLEPIETTMIRAHGLDRPIQTTPQLREVHITQYNTIAGDMDIRRAAEEAYQEFMRKIGERMP